MIRFDDKPCGGKGQQIGDQLYAAPKVVDVGQFNYITELQAAGADILFGYDYIALFLCNCVCGCLSDLVFWPSAGWLGFDHHLHLGQLRAADVQCRCTWFIYFQDLL